MTAVTRNDLNANVLQTWLRRQTLKVFEPNLRFLQMGEAPMIDDGYQTLAWAKFDQIAASAVTAGTTSNDGVTPSDTDFDGTITSLTPLQYRVVVNLSDMVIERNVINFLQGASNAVGKALARRIDQVVQTTIMAGTNVKYAGTGNTTRAGLAAGDNLTVDLFNFASSFLDQQDADKYEMDAYVAVIHPYQQYDLRASTAAGSWIDLHKYPGDQKLFNGEIGMLHGVRVVKSSHVQTFASTVTVYPCLVFGAASYGVGKAQNIQVYLTPNVASDSDPLAQRRKTGAKVAFGTLILQQAGMMRVESAATAVITD